MANITVDDTLRIDGFLMGIAHVLIDISRPGHGLLSGSFVYWRMYCAEHFDRTQFTHTTEHLT
jgi:hypothetical protein